MDGSEVNDISSGRKPTPAYLADKSLEAFGLVMSIDPLDGYASEDPLAWHEPFANERIIQAGLKYMDKCLLSGYQGVLICGL